MIEVFDVFFNEANGKFQVVVEYTPRSGRFVYGDTAEEALENAAQDLAAYRLTNGTHTATHR